MGGLLGFDGCICCNTSLYIDIPACIGFSGSWHIFCFECSYCLKLGESPKKFILCDCNIGGFKPVFRMQDQVCCCVESCSCPPGADGVPITFGKFFIFCYPSFGIAPSAQSMLR